MSNIKPPRLSAKNKELWTVSDDQRADFLLKKRVEEFSAVWSISAFESAYISSAYKLFTEQMHNRFDT